VCVLKTPPRQERQKKNVGASGGTEKAAPHRTPNVAAMLFASSGDEDGVVS
jgi:hypothetical protein